MGLHLGGRDLRRKKISLKIFVAIFMSIDKKCQGKF
jgi:hypothetical protein